MQRWRRKGFEKWSQVKSLLAFIGQREREREREREEKMKQKPFCPTAIVGACGLYTHCSKWQADGRDRRRKQRIMRQNKRELLSGCNEHGDRTKSMDTIAIIYLWGDADSKVQGI